MKTGPLLPKLAQKQMWPTFFSETWCITVVVRMGRAKAAITATTTVLKRLRGSY